VTEQILDSMREQNRQRLGVAQAEPYFGRLDFHEKGTKASVPLYIGKAGVDDLDSGRPLVIDWRAPVASLFYTYTGGEGPAEYDSPDGLIEGLVYLKRNLVIRRRILQRVVDTYTKGSDNAGVSDEFLLYRLGENKDNKLRDIVSTIQAEQDRIIRSVKNKALFIQGVAGSGKTTVALHRLAYLLYQYRESVRADRMIIFAPNRMFLDYISGVLPELGVGDIQQTTFADWALKRLEDPLKLSDEAAELEFWFAPGREGEGLEQNETPPGRYKGSVEFGKLVAEELDRFEEGYLREAADFAPWDGAKLRADVIRDWFYVENKHYPLAKRREKVIARIKRWMEIELEKTWEVHLKKERKKLASTRLRAYVKTWPDVSPLAFYRNLMESGLEKGAIPSGVAEATIKRLKKKEAAPEDLAPLLMIHNRLHGLTAEDHFDHIVLDEAQDFSPLQVSLLKEHSRGSSFTVLGDLAQGIHDYKGIVNWSEFINQFPGEEENAYFQLNRSYRSTMEIIEFANQVLAGSGVSVAPAVPVFRSGDPVRVESAGRGADRLKAVVSAVRELQQGDITTVAVIARTLKESRAIHEALAEAGLAPALITPEQRSYGGGLSVLPVYLSKGLEFDAVLLVDADEKHYPATHRNAKLLYVACTRALHRLRVLYSGHPSPLLGEG